MEWKVLYTEPALADVESIKDWSWAFHPDTTERFISALLNHIDLLEMFPRMGTPVRNHPNVRRLVHTPVWIFYRVNDDKRRVEILHVWHHARSGPPRF